jgi:hypothetical protein
VVVSPDHERAGAHEHFEHAGVGHVVREALRRVADRGEHRVAAHLRSVDPRFVAAYRDLAALDALHAGPGGRTLRALQIHALRAHATQRDATEVAVETLAGLRWEYYEVEVRDADPAALDRLLGPW